MHHLTPRVPPICRKDHPCIERSASLFQLFPLTMGDRRWARAGRAVPPLGALCGQARAAKRPPIMRLSVSADPAKSVLDLGELLTCLSPVRSEDALRVGDTARAVVCLDRWLSLLRQAFWLKRS